MYGSRLLKSTIQMACLNPTSVYCSNANEAEQIIANYNNEDNEVQCTVDILRDLLDIRDGMKECDLLSKDEIGQMIDFLMYILIYSCIFTVFFYFFYFLYVIDYL